MMQEARSLFKCVCGCTIPLELNRMQKNRKIFSPYVFDICNPLYDERVVIMACSRCGMLQAVKLSITQSDASIKMKNITQEMLKDKGGADDN